MKNTPPKCYRCTDYGADATAHEEEGFFVVHAGSKFGPIRNRRDNMMLNFRRALRREEAFKRGLVLKGDEKFLYADETARIVTGCLCDETSWIAEDGSHPTMKAPSPPTVNARSKENAEMEKKIFIYFGAYGEDYGGGAVAELSCKANGKVYAFVSSPRINKVWRDFQKRISVHGIKGNSSLTLIAELALTLFTDKHVPFRCLRRLNDTKWACTERCIVGDETAKELML